MQYDQFYKKWQGRIIEDAGSYNSSEALIFSGELKSVLNAEFNRKYMMLLRYRIGHYYVSGFVKSDARFVYFSYTFPRRIPVDLNDTGINGFMYRTAESLSDFVGGNNHYSDLKNLSDNIFALVNPICYV